MHDSTTEGQIVFPQTHCLDAGDHGGVSATPWHALPQSFRVLADEKQDAILLETAKQDGDQDKSLLFLDPIETWTANTAHDLDGLLREIDRRVEDGLFVAGFFGYECGEHFSGLSPRATKTGASDEPMAWFGAFARPIEFDHCSGTIRGELPAMQSKGGQSEDAVIHTNGLQISREEYDAAIARIHHYLQEGHTYQVNFTDRIEGETEADPLAVYQTLLRQQPVPFAAYVNCSTGPLLSFSPELFFRTTQGRITVRPMKGTWPRGRDLAEDRVARSRLLNDAKNRSEHVMIVDLLRNDLGRICTYGSVGVNALFQVEPYNTLLQMTSTCSGQLREGLSPTQILTSLFPSGSITGAPKRRTMEIIRELERQPRGAYTGCIGYFGPDGESCFNVAIRTVEMKGGRMAMGVGGGITADSKAEEEFEECRLKADFLTRRRPPFSLIETMRSMDGEVPLLARHMQRLSDSASYFGFRYDRNALRRELLSISSAYGGAETKIRLVLHENGEWTIASSPLETMEWNGRLVLAEERVRTTDVFLHHKTTHRDLYDRCLASAHRLGFDEVLLLNESGALTEGAISNIFLQVGDRWITPDLASGVLPGVQRSCLLEQLQGAEEREIRLDDLIEASSVYVCNALRGIRPVTSIETVNRSVLWRKS